VSFSYEEWEKEFAPKLKDTMRWEGYSFIAKRLSRVASPRIVETGCIRTESDWAGNGQSTLQWQWMAQQDEAIEVESVDIDPKNCVLAERLCPNVWIHNSDSIEFLSTKAMREPDLLFLDSYDHDPPYGPSELHAVGELACVWDRLKSGCMIAVDDCNGDGTGKHYLIRHFFDRMGIKPAVASYIHVWIKP